MKVLLGADPEVFLRKDGQLVSAYGAVAGTKLAPQPVDHGAVQVDGMALEFNIDPADTVERWCFNLQVVMNQLKELVPEGELQAIPVAEFGEDYINSQPEEARELGCDPDYNAYTGEINPKPDERLPFRTAAGHIHLGLTDRWDVSSPNVMDVCCRITKQLDAYLGVPSVLLDSCNKRREMYGKAGAFRVKPYGLEYRVLSNFWLNNVTLMEWVFNTVQRAVSDWEDGLFANDVFPDEFIEDTVNTSNREQAADIIQQLKVGVPNV